MIKWFTTRKQIIAENARLRAELTVVRDVATTLRRSIMQQQARIAVLERHNASLSDAYAATKSPKKGPPSHIDGLQRVKPTPPTSKVIKAPVKRDIQPPYRAPEESVGSFLAGAIAGVVVNEIFSSSSSDSSPSSSPDISSGGGGDFGGGGATGSWD